MKGEHRQMSVLSVTMCSWLMHWALIMMLWVVLRVL
jgi:hypothetical protein